MKDYHAEHATQWNYLGIDQDPPSGKIHVLTVGGQSAIGSKHTVGIIAWHGLMKRDKIKEKCQEILRGLPELRMIGCIVRAEHLLPELSLAIEHYTEDNLGTFVDLVRNLDRQSHAGVACIPNAHA